MLVWTEKQDYVIQGDEGYSKLKKIAQYKFNDQPNDITYVPGEDGCYIGTNGGRVYKFNNNAQIVWQKSVFDEIGYIKSIRPFDAVYGQVMVGGIKAVTAIEHDGSYNGFVKTINDKAKGVYISNQRGEEHNRNFILYAMSITDHLYTYSIDQSLTKYLVERGLLQNVKEIKCCGSFYVDRGFSAYDSIRHLISYYAHTGTREFELFNSSGSSIGNEFELSTQTTTPITAIGSFGKSGIKLLVGYGNGLLECLDVSTIPYSVVWRNRISDQGAITSISVGERITIVSYNYGKIRIFDTNTMNEIENDGEYVKRITAISQGDTNDHIVYVINGTGGSGETSNSLCVFEYQN